MRKAQLVVEESADSKSDLVPVLVLACMKFHNPNTTKDGYRILVDWTKVRDITKRLTDKLARVLKDDEVAPGVFRAVARQEIEDVTSLDAIRCTYRGESLPLVSTQVMVRRRGVVFQGFDGNGEITASKPISLAAIEKMVADSMPEQPEVQVPEIKKLLMPLSDGSLLACDWTRFRNWIAEALETSVTQGLVNHIGHINTVPAFRTVSNIDLTMLRPLADGKSYVIVDSEVQCLVADGRYVWFLVSENAAKRAVSTRCYELAELDRYAGLLVDCSVGTQVSDDDIAQAEQGIQELTAIEQAVADRVKRHYESKISELEETVQAQAAVIAEKDELISELERRPVKLAFRGIPGRPMRPIVPSQPWDISRTPFSEPTTILICEQGPTA